MTSKETSRRKVLIVEDDPEITHSYRENLFGYFHVITVRSGAGAVGIAKSMRGIDIVLLDYLLPDMTGIDVLREIKKALPSVPVILVTGQGTEDLAVRSFRGGVTDYIKKPFKFDVLISRMESLLSRSQRPEEGPSPEFHECDGNADKAPSDFSPQHFLRIQKVVRFIDDNYIADIDLKEAGRIACMSPWHFSRLFRKANGIGFREYLHRKRIEKARELLRNPALSVAEIAFAVGYRDITHFDRIFKKATRSTPSAYRNDLPKD